MAIPGGGGGKPVPAPSFDLRRGASSCMDLGADGDDPMAIVQRSLIVPQSAYKLPTLVSMMVRGTRRRRVGAVEWVALVLLMGFGRILRIDNGGDVD